MCINIVSKAMQLFITPTCDMENMYNVHLYMFMYITFSVLLQEEENARLNAAKRRLSREIEELQENLEAMQRDRAR